MVPQSSGADDKDGSEELTDHRRDEIARRMLGTPPKPHKRKRDEGGQENLGRPRKKDDQNSSSS